MFHGLHPPKLLCNTTARFFVIKSGHTHITSCQFTYSQMQYRFV